MARAARYSTRRDLLKQAGAVAGAAPLPLPLVAQGAPLETVRLSARTSAIVGRLDLGSVRQKPSCSVRDARWNFRR